MKTIIDLIKREDLVLSYVQHDWSSVKGDPAMDYRRAIIGYAREQGVEIPTRTAHYQRMLALRTET